MKSRVPAPARQAAAVQRRAQAEPRARAGSRAPSLHVVGSGLDGAVLVRLQATAGNQAVGQLLSTGTAQAAGSRLSVQAQAAACPPAPVEAPHLSPKDDPKFAAVGSRIGHETARQKAHPPPAAKVAEAQGAAAGPTNEVRSKAAADQVDEMSQKKPKGFDKAGFVKAFNEAVEKATPKNMEQVDDFSKSGKAAQIKDQVVGNVAAGKDAAAKDVKEANSAPPDTSKEKPKPVRPLKPEQPGPGPADPRAGDAMPAPRPADQVSLAHTPCETEGQMAEGGVTEQQVKDSNEPQFQDAMSAKKEADAHAATAPQQFRQQEQQALGEAQGGAAVAAAGGLSAMHQQKAGALGHVATHKDQAKAKDEAERARVATDIEAIYTDTKKDVDDILKGLDKKVGDAFDSGEKAAREAFETYYKKKKDDFFDDRYSGLGGGLRWLKDKLISPPDEVNGFIVESKQLYTTRMGQVVDGVANLVEAELNRATKRVQDGRKQIQEYVAKQPKELRKVAQEAAAKFESSFEELDQAVDSKSGELVDDLAQRYVEAAKAVDERCNEMREENKSLLQKAKDKIAGMIEAIGKIKDMLAQMAARAANVAGRIIKHPIDFLGKLVDALKMGFNQFVGNIGKHLMDGLLGWLFGELADTGITMPESLDLKGILHLVLQVLGLTWENIRKRAAAMLGEEVVGMIEQGAGMFQKVANIFNTIKTEGLAGLWHLIQDKIGDLKSQVLDQIMNFVRDKIITAGVTWILSLLNPASAFIKACKMIYDIVMFFVERGQQIMALVNTILDNLEAILDGNLSAAANLVESVMAKGLTVAISFLASLLGVGGITDKIKEVINVVRSPVFKAVDWVLKTIVKPVAKLAAKAVGWVKGKAKAGADWVKAKGKAGIDKIKGRFGRKDAGKKDPETVKGLVAKELAGKKIHGPENAKSLIDSTFAKYKPQGLKSLELIPPAKGGTDVTVLAVASPARRIQMSTDPREVIRLAMSLRSRTSKTSAYVSYDNGRPFPANGRPYTTRGDRAGHAEMRLAADVPALIQAIEADRRNGTIRTAPGKRVPVRIDMNRLPCDHCGRDRIVSAFAPYSRLVKVEVSASSVWKQAEHPNIDFTSAPGVKRLLDADMEVKPLDVWPIVEQKLRSMGIQEVMVGGEVWSLQEWIDKYGGSRAEDLEEVRDVISKANDLRKKDTLKRLKTA